jgi:hypothetical protein
MSTSLLFRQAKASDIPFLVEAIIAAEKSGTDRLSYATIYGTLFFLLSYPRI